MIKFITTQGVNYYLEELLKNAQTRIIIISPYIRLQRRIRNILQEKKNKGLEIIFICRIDDLKEPLNEYSSHIYDSPSLHAKCYLNEKEAIVTSLNIYEFSQQNNDEMGIYVKNEESGKNVYNDIILEAKRLCKNKLGSRKPTKQQQNQIFEKGVKYTADYLEEIFIFDYKGRAGIKISSSGNIVLFSNPSAATPYNDKEHGEIIYYQGQNTGGGEQKLIYGNKKLYDSFGNDSIKIYLFKNLEYQGEFSINREPYLDKGKWIFPLSAKYFIQKTKYYNLHMNIRKKQP
jgi:hypothetical protein